MPAFHLSITQWIAFASAMFTLASVTVAVVAARFSYRQNYGWKPVILVLSPRFEGTEGDYTARIDFEIWNRRKYPVVIHLVEVELSRSKLNYSEALTSHPWYMSHNKLVHREHVRLDPADHHVFEAWAQFKKHTPEDQTVRINVSYFDPVANKREKLTTRQSIQIRRYEFTEPS